MRLLAARRESHDRFSDLLLLSLPALAVFWTLMGAYARFPTIFDSGAFYDCLRHAVRGPFDIREFSCFDHPSVLFIAIYALPQYLADSLVTMHAVTTVLGSFAIVAFSAILSLLAPEREYRVTRALACMLFAANGVLVGNAVGFTLDIGVVFFYFPFLALLLHKRHALAMLCGFLLVLTKESGIALYGMTVVAYNLLTFAPNPKGFPWFRELKRWSLFLPPFLLLGAYFALRSLVFHLPLLHSEDLPPIHKIVFAFDPFDRRFQVVVAEIFLFQFQWIATAFLVGGVALLLRRCGTRPRDIVRSPLFVPVGVIALVFLGGTHVFGRAMPYNNLRYLLPLFPLLTLLSFAAMRSLLPDPRVLSGVIAGMVALSGVSLFRSADPVSRAVLGVIPFGEHSMYAMEAIMGGCCGHGRDQLVYNLEHAKFVSLQEKLLARLRPTQDTVIVLEPAVLFWLPDSYHPDRGTLAWFGEGVRPRYMGIPELFSQKPLPPAVFVADYPFVMNGPVHDLLLTQYRITGTERIRDGGYSMEVHTAVLKDPLTPPGARSTTPPS